MTPTHCPNCGAAMTEENSGKYCLYCGGKLPEPEQHITNNFDNRVENHYHTTIIQQAAPTYDPNAYQLPEDQREKKFNISTAIIAGVMLLTIVIVTIILKAPVVLVLVIAVAAYFIKNMFIMNYCPHCFAPKDFKKSVCPHCHLDAYKSASSQTDSRGNAKKQQGISCSGMLGAFLFVIVVFFLILQIGHNA